MFVGSNFFVQYTTITKIRSITVEGQTYTVTQTVFSTLTVEQLETAYTTPEEITGKAAWISVGPGGGGFLLSCEIDPRDSNIFYVGSDVAGIHKTTDGGESWRAINNGLESAGADGYGVEQIKIDPNNPDIIYAATWSGLYKSIDSGENWRRILPKEDKVVPVFSVDVDQLDNLFIVAGSSALDESSTVAGVVYISYDGGESWKAIRDSGIGSDAEVYAVVIDHEPQSGARAIYAGTTRGVYVSEDDGASWRAINEGLPQLNVIDLEMSGDSTLYALLYPTDDEDGGVFKRPSGGDRWIDITGDLPKAPYTELTLDPSDSSRIYVGLWEWIGVDVGVYATQDGGESWRLITRPDNMEYGWAYGWWSADGANIICVAPNEPSTLIHGTNTVFISKDRGKTWRQIYTTEKGDNLFVGRGLELTFAYDMAFDPVEAGRFYIGYDDIWMWRTDDSGATFTLLQRPSQLEELGYDAISSIVIDPNNPSTIYASASPKGLAPNPSFASSEGAILKSTDYGESWEVIAAGQPGVNDGVAHLYISDDSSLYALVYGSGVFISRDGGENWAEISTGIGAESMYAWTMSIVGNQMFLGLNSFGEGEGGLYVSTNGGVEWSKIESIPVGDILAIAVDQARGIILVSGMDPDWSGGGLYLSRDGGATWTEVLDQPYIFSIEINQNQILAAASVWWATLDNQQPAIYISKDGGESWSPIKTQPPHKYIIFIKIDPRNNSILYVGTQGGGVYKIEEW